MPDPIVISVPGIPAPQGSKVRNRYGGVRESNPNTMPWRGLVTTKAAETMRGRPPLATPVHVNVRFTFPRPKSHYRSGKHALELRHDAPTWCDKKPDLDKLQRAIGDSLSGVAIRDDSRIVSWDAVKVYGDSAGCEITVSEAT